MASPEGWEAWAILLWRMVMVLVTFFSVTGWYIVNSLWNVILGFREVLGGVVWDAIKKLWEEVKLRWRGKRRNVNTTNFCPQLVDDFQKLAWSLSPPKEYFKEGKKTTEKIFQALRKNFKISRTVVAGSMGKRTGISYIPNNNNVRKNPDFDLVVFIDDDIGEPPYNRVLERFKYIIGSLGREFQNIKRSRISVQFTYQNGHGDIHFDLLPAKNHVIRPIPFQNVGQLEAERALETVRMRHLENIREHARISTDDNKLFSSSFCEKTVAIIKERVLKFPFYFQMVRLAKYWNSRIDLGIYVPARSSIIEMIAIHSQIGKRKKCLIGGFIRFLDEMSNLGTLRIGKVATIAGANSVQVDTEDAFDTDQLLQMFSEFYKTPIILDPANPYNNLAHGIDPSAIRIFEEQARKTKRVLSRFRQSSQYERVENVIDEIFCHK